MPAMWTRFRFIPLLLKMSNNIRREEPLLLRIEPKVSGLLEVRVAAALGNLASAALRTAELCPSCGVSYYSTKIRQGTGEIRCVVGAPCPFPLRFLRERTERPGTVNVSVGSVRRNNFVR